MKDAEFRAFIQGERRRLIHYVRSRFKDTAVMDAEDVVQDVLIKLLERPRSSAPFGDLTAYVYRSVKNRVIDLMRTRKSTVSFDSDSARGSDGESAGLITVLEDQSPHALDVLQSEQGRRQLFDALSALSDVERHVVIAQEFEGRSFRELSTELKIPLNTLLSHKARAMKKMKDHFANLK